MTTFRKNTIFTFALVLFIYGLAVTSVKAELDEARAKEFFIKVASECITDDIKEDDIEALMKDDSASHEGKCLIACLMKKLGVLDENGELSPAGVNDIREKMQSFGGDSEKGHQIATAILEKCSNLKEEDECETAYQIHQCARGEIKAIRG
ncbi:unnamed protein product [Hermetia illucens]|uniref:Uncharacterized protein n=1 Tax=Hermetia illucens TaxID=343691 RepID=A0A7R8UU89_HERIL|nr:general odorant-binding protein 28a-like [Hermetia illucens]CAD7087144.1 unnamed protein product [Hermetia illucens]